MSSHHTWVLPAAPTAAAEARGLVEGVCRDMPTTHVEVARLLVSELVTNAVQHSTGEVLLVVARRDSRLRVEVHDASSVLPVLTEQSSLAERGWGLRLVASLASSWGVGPRDDGRSGKQVWFTLA